MRTRIPLCLLFALATNLFGRVMDYRADGFSINVPDSWREIPAKALADYGATMSKLSGGKINESYQYGYQRDYDGQWLMHPYILVQIKEIGRLPERQLGQLKQLRKGVEQGLDKAAKSMDGMLSDMSLGETLYDPTNNCLWLQFSGTVGGVGNFRGLSCSYLTEKGLMLFHFYARESEFEKLLPLFQEMAESVHIGEGLKYVSRGDRAGGFDFGRVGRGALIGGLIGGVCGLVMLITKKLGAKKTPPPLPPLTSM